MRNAAADEEEDEEEEEAGQLSTQQSATSARRLSTCSAYSRRGEHKHDRSSSIMLVSRLVSFTHSHVFSVAAVVDLLCAHLFISSSPQPHT